MNDTTRMAAELRAAALREVLETYRTQNGVHFGGRLRTPVLEWSERSSELGAWVSETRTLRLSERLLEGPWGVLVEVLKHEMAHQFVHEVLGVTDEGPHGATFRRVCEERGIDRRAAGVPDDDPEREPARAAAFRKILHLLSLAESDNPHEAESAAILARRLMLKYQLEHGQSRERTFAFRHLGPPLVRRHAYQRVIANILDEYFFVQVIVVPSFDARRGKRASVLEAIGDVDNLEIASYAHDFLEMSGERLWKQHKRAKRLRGDRERLDYLFGVMSGFREKLAKEAETARGEGLVVARSPELARYFRARHPYTRSVSGRGSVEKEAFAAGAVAGRELVLSKGLRGVDRDGGSPRLLPGKR